MGRVGSSGMRKKVAVPSNDGVSISQHFGRSDRFAVFEVDYDQILAEEFRTGTTNARGDDSCDTTRIREEVLAHCRSSIDLLSDCQVVLCRGMNWRVAAELVRHGINPLVIAGDLSPRVAVEHYLAGTLHAAPASAGATRKQRPRMITPGLVGEQQRAGRQAVCWRRERLCATRRRTRRFIWRRTNTRTMCS